MRKLWRFVYKAVLLFTNLLKTEKNLCISAKFDNSSDMDRDGILPNFAQEDLGILVYKCLNAK